MVLAKRKLKNFCSDRQVRNVIIKGECMEILEG